MYISNRKLINRYFNDIDNIDVILKDLYTIYKLYKKFGKLLLNKKILSYIENNYKDIATFIKVFWKLWKLNDNDILDLINLLKNKYSDYTKSFYVEWNEEILEKVEDILNKKFGKISVNLDKEKDVIGLFVKGEWYYFKKFLSKDLDKILNI